MDPGLCSVVETRSVWPEGTENSVNSAISLPCWNQRTWPPSGAG